MKQKIQTLVFFTIIFSAASYYSKFIGKVPLSNKILFKIPFWVFLLLSFCTLTMILWDKFGEKGIEKRAKELNKFILFYCIVLFPFLYAMTSTDWNILRRAFFSISFASIAGLWLIFFIKEKKLKKT